MTPLEDLQLVALAEVKPGQFLFSSTSADRSSVFLKATTEGPPEVLAIWQNDGKTVAKVERARTDLFLAFKRTRILVDPASQVHGTRCSPAPGTILLTAQGPGILYENPRGHEAVFLLTGEVVETQWGRDTGYYHWHLEALDGDYSRTTLFAVDVPPIGR